MTIGDDPFRNAKLVGPIETPSDTADHPFVPGDDPALCRRCGEHSSWHPDPSTSKPSDVRPITIPEGGS